MKALLLGARGAVGTVISRELTTRGHEVTAASRTAPGDAGIDLHADLGPLRRLAGTHDVVINASGIERPALATAAGATPLIDISATGSYLEELRGATAGTALLGAGLIPGLSTLMADALPGGSDDEIDVMIMLGAGEQHGPAAVAWTAGLIGSELHRPPEARAIRNLREHVRATGPDGRMRSYLRADFPDHVLLGRTIRSYLTLSSAPMTLALALIARLPRLRGILERAPHLGSDAWHLVVTNRSTGRRLQATGAGQSEATGRLTALAAERIAGTEVRGAITMADLLTLDEAMAALGLPSTAPSAS